MGRCLHWKDDVVYAVVFELFKAFAFQFIPAAANMQARDYFVVTGFRGLYSAFECFKPVGILVSPGEEQPICTGFDSGFCASRVVGCEFDDEGGGSWLDFRPVFA